MLLRLKVMLIIVRKWIIQLQGLSLGQVLRKFLTIQSIANLAGWNLEESSTDGDNGEIYVDVYNKVKTLSRKI
ncbi:hypothetical protein YA5_008950 [Tetragenococcus halophilus]|nr:hypothetical protein YA5_008950 [Tetragenococcus halophilus]